MSKYILAIDQGTTGTTRIRRNGTFVAKVNEEYRQIYPQPGWVEHHPGDIWKSVVSCIRKVFEVTGTSGQDVAAIGITNQRETALIWERATGRPIYNAVVWQCRRTTRFCESLKKKGLGPKIRKRTGLVVDPYFSASKFKWILDEVSGSRAGVRRGELVGGTIDTYLIGKLTMGTPM